MLRFCDRAPARAGPGIGRRAAREAAGPVFQSPYRDAPKVLRGEPVHVPDRYYPERCAKDCAACGPVWLTEKASEALQRLEREKAIEASGFGPATARMAVRLDLDKDPSFTQLEGRLRDWGPHKRPSNRPKPAPLPPHPPIVGVKK